MQEPPSGFWVILTAGSHKHGKSVLKKLKDLAAIVTQRVTSVMLISTLLNTILVPSLENIVAPACKTLTMAGAAGVAGYCWLQSSSAQVWHMHCQHVITFFTGYSDAMYVTHVRLTALLTNPMGC